MNADERRFKHNDLTRGIIGTFFHVYNELGYGFLESVYPKAMAIALRASGLHVEEEFPVQARFRGKSLGSLEPTSSSIDGSLSS
jgi:GxxExxY protein